MHQGLYTLVNPVLDVNGTSRSTCSFICGMKDCLGEKGYMNPTNTNRTSWQAAARRGWCNGGFRGAIPAALQQPFKQFKCVTGDWDGTQAGGANITTHDYFALAAGKEVFNGGSGTLHSTNNEATALTQFTWYATTENRRKKVAGSVGVWWERSPLYNTSTGFCDVRANGGEYPGNASNTSGLAPFGCL